MRHGVVTGSPVSRTTIVFGWAAATAEIRSSWLPVFPVVVQSTDVHALSMYSPSLSDANTIATLAAFATAAAEVASLPSL